MSLHRSATPLKPWGLIGVQCLCGDLGETSVSSLMKCCVFVAMIKLKSLHR